MCNSIRQSNSKAFKLKLIRTCEESIQSIAINWRHIEKREEKGGRGEGRHFSEGRRRGGRRGGGAANIIISREQGTTSVAPPVGK